MTRETGFCILRPVSCLLTPDAGRWTLDFRISGISQQRQHEKERAEHILAFGDPGDRFHMQRVQREERRDERAAPDRAGHAAEDLEEQEGVGDVEQKACQVVPARLHPEQLHVRHVRQPSQRVIVVVESGAEGPTDIRPIQSLQHVGI